VTAWSEEACAQSALHVWSSALSTEEEPPLRPSGDRFHVREKWFVRERVPC
jgi:hypothetical protein